MQKRGFTLIEILVVIGILAILLGAAIVALNPGRQFAQARDSQRWSHVDAILNAVYFNMAENDGVWTCAAGGLPTTTATELASSGGYDICDCLVPIHLASMPVDPTDGSYTDCATYAADYTIIQNPTTSRVTVAAPAAELETISLSR